MQTLRDTIRGVLTRFPEVQLCIVFGSAATGQWFEDSDLDVAVAAGQTLASERRLELIEALSTAARKEVDLIDLMGVSGPILKQALSKGIVMQNEDKGLYGTLIFRMLVNQADMIPYHDRTLRERRKRFLNG